MKECYQNLSTHLAQSEGSVNISCYCCMPVTQKNHQVSVISQMRKLRLRVLCHFAQSDKNICKVLQDLNPGLSQTRTWKLSFCVYRVNGQALDRC